MTDPDTAALIKELRQFGDLLDPRGPIKQTIYQAADRLEALSQAPAPVVTDAMVQRGVKGWATSLHGNIQLVVRDVLIAALTEPGQ